MRTLLLFAVLLGAAGAADGVAPVVEVEAEAPADLDAMLDERIALNRAYRDEFAANARAAATAATLEPLERRNGQAWVDFLTYVRAGGDRQLKIHVLRIELLGELAGCAWDLEHAETLMERATATTMMQGWQAAVDQLERLAAEPAP